MAITTAAPRTASAVPASTRLAVRLGLLLVGVGLAMAAYQHATEAGTDAPSTPLAAQAHDAYQLPNLSHLIQHAGLIVAAVCVVGVVATVRGLAHRL
jgi:hypothetical protein